MKLLVFFILFFLVSCYTEKKATKQIKKAYLEHENVVAKKCAEWFPCITEVISIDTTNKLNDSISIKIVNIRDTIKYVLSDSSISKTKFDVLRSKLQQSDSMIALLHKLLKEKPTTIIQTIKVKDSAQLQNLNLHIAQLEKDLQFYRLKNEKRSDWVVYLLIGFFISVILNILQFKK